MARDESNREDLLREATALVERIELMPRNGVWGQSAPIVAGFRRDGALSVFFGEDPVFHFNAAGELRRAYCDGLLIKAVRGELVSLRRLRTECEVQLVRHTLSGDEQTEFLSAMKNRLRWLAKMIAAQDFECGRQVPPDADVLGRVCAWLSEYKTWSIADRPNV